MFNELEIRKSIGATIRAGRLNKGFTQAMLAEKVEMDEKQLSRLEAGKHFPTLKTLISIINVLGMQLGDFDNLQKAKEPEFYTLVDILRTSSPKELKKYLKIIKLIKDN